MKCAEDREAFFLILLMTVLAASWAGCMGPEKKGDEALAGGDYSTAIGFFSEASEQSPKDAEVLNKLGLAYFRMGEEQVNDPSLGGDPGSAFADAAHFFQKAFKIDRDLTQACLMLAKALYMNGIYDEAFKAVTDYVAILPEDPKGWVLAGRIALARGRASTPEEQSLCIDAALGYLEKAVEIDPKISEAYLYCGDGYLQKGEIGRAAEIYRKGIRACPESNDLHGRLLYLKGAEGGMTPKEAIAFYNELLEGEEASRSAAGKATLWWFLGSWNAEKGSAHYGREEYDLARECFEQHIKCLETCAGICPDFTASVEENRVTALLNRGWALLKLLRLAEAERDMFEAMDIIASWEEDPGENQALVLAIDSLGFAVFQKDGIEGGLEFHRRLTSLWGKRHEWWNNYGFFSLEANMAAQAPIEQYEETYRVYEKALECKPDYPRYLNDKGMLLLYYLDLEGERREEAEELFKKAWKLGKEAYESPFTDEGEKEVYFSSYTDALVNLGRLYLLQGNVDACRTMLDELIKDAPDRPEVQEIKESFEKYIEDGTPYILIR